MFLVSSSFLRHYDETKTLPYARPLNGLIRPDGEQCDFIKDDGCGSVIISFPGEVYHGVDINHELLGKIKDMGLTLGIEVFPDWEI